MMNKLLISLILLLPLVVSTQTTPQEKRFIVELYTDDRRINKTYIRCDSFYLYKDRQDIPYIKVINYNIEGMETRIYRAIRVKNLLPACDTAFWE